MSYEIPKIREFHDELLNRDKQSLDLPASAAEVSFHSSFEEAAVVFHQPSVAPTQDTTVRGKYDDHNHPGRDARNIMRLAPS